MVNFENKILKTVTEKLRLRRMRFKVDPAIANLEDFDGDTSYEGYVLNENQGVVTILIVDPNNGVRQTQAYSQSLNVLSPDLNVFKKNIVQMLLNKVPEQVLMQIQNAATFDEVEQLARQNRATNEQIQSAQSSLKNENTLNEQNRVRSAIGKAGDIAQDVAFGKDNKGFFGKVGGLLKMPGRVGKTLSKIAKGNKLDFTERSSIYHKDKPRAGQTISIDYKGNDGKRHIITGKISAFETTSGDKNFIRIKNAVADPEIEDLVNIGDILVDFDVSKPGADFHVYDTNKRRAESFSGQIQYNSSTKSWVADNSGKSKDTKPDESGQDELKKLEQKYGSETFQETGGKKRKLFKIKNQDIYFDSNYNRQKPQST